jgi:hypothetical protein
MRVRTFLQALDWWCEARWRAILTWIVLTIAPFATPSGIRTQIWDEIASAAYQLSSRLAMQPINLIETG